MIRFVFAVKTLREERDWTQEVLAHKVGIHRTYLSDIERGHRNVSLVNIERIALAFDIPLKELFSLL